MWYLHRLRSRCLVAQNGDEAAADRMREAARDFFRSRPTWAPRPVPPSWFTRIDGTCDEGRPMHVIRPVGASKVLQDFNGDRKAVLACYLDHVHQLGALNVTEIWDVREAAFGIADTFAAMQIFYEIAPTMRDFYPERVRRVVILGAGAVREWVRSLLPERTLHKVVWIEAPNELAPYVREWPKISTAVP